MAAAIAHSFQTKANSEFTHKIVFHDFGALRCAKEDREFLHISYWIQRLIRLGAKDQWSATIDLQGQQIDWTTTNHKEVPLNLCSLG